MHMCEIHRTAHAFGRVLQCVAVCCSVLQCVAVRCSVLQCIAVCCIITNEAATLLTVESMWRKRSSINSIKYLGVYYNLSSSYSPMGWLRLVGSLKLLVSFADYSLFSRALLQKSFVGSLYGVENVCMGLLR